MRAWSTGLVVALVLHLLQLPAAAQSFGAAAVKARLALAVARFAEFPEAPPREAIRFCIAGKEDIPRAFKDLAGQRIGTREVEVVAGSASGACDILFVDESAPQWRVLLAQRTDAALTIGDVPGFLVGGGMVELVLENDSVRFDVNLGALRQRRIRLPAQVLQLARRVQE